MPCDRCGREGTLTTYALSGRRALVCEGCGFVGIPTDHRGEGPPRANETWDDALDRFEGDGDRLAAITVAGETPRFADHGDPPVTVEEIGSVSVDIGLTDGSSDADEGSMAPSSADPAAPVTPPGPPDRSDENAAEVDGEGDAVAVGAVPEIEAEHAERLLAAGVRTAADLLSSTPEALAEAASVPPERAEQWMKLAEDDTESDLE